MRAAADVGARTRAIERAAAGAVLLVHLVTIAACGGRSPEASVTADTRPGSPRAVVTGGSGATRSAQGIDPCALITEGDVRRISGYANTMTQPGMSEGSCLRRTPDDRFSIVITLGRYVDLRSSLGGRHVDLGHGLVGYENSTGWVTAVIYPDGSAVNLGISGRAMSNESRQAGYRLTLADGSVADMAAQYRAYVDIVVSRAS